MLGGQICKFNRQVVLKARLAGLDEHIMFGDSGYGHVFISKKDLVQKDFSKAYFYFDCH